MRENDIPEQCSIERYMTRRCGGWLGVYDNGSLRFGVTADTKAAAQVRLAESLERWNNALSRAEDVLREG